MCPRCHMWFTHRAQTENASARGWGTVVAPGGLGASCPLSTPLTWVWVGNVRTRALAQGPTAHPDRVRVPGPLPHLSFLHDTQDFCLVPPPSHSNTIQKMLVPDSPWAVHPSQGKNCWLQPGSDPAKRKCSPCLGELRARPVGGPHTILLPLHSFSSGELLAGGSEEWVTVGLCFLSMWGSASWGPTHQETPFWGKKIAPQELSGFLEGFLEEGELEQAGTLPGFVCCMQLTGHGGGHCLSMGHRHQTSLRPREVTQGPGATQPFWGKQVWSWAWHC